MTTQTTNRTCDAMGGCQGHSTPCAGCGNAHPAYHHLHRVQHICQADKCSQGRAACPVPQACEVADAADAGHPGSEAGCVPSVAGFVLMILACLGCAALVIDFIEMALSA